MQRRTFFWYLGSGLAAEGLSDDASRAASLDTADRFISEFGLAVGKSFELEWSRDDLEEYIGDRVGYLCYAYGLLEEDGNSYTKTEGFLARFQEYSFEEVTRSEDFLRWFSENAHDIVDFLEYFDVLSDSVVEKLKTAIESIGDVMKFVPLVGSLKHLFESGCSLHATLEEDGRAPREELVRFFQSVALVAVEIVLLASGIAVSYRVAYAGAGWANRQLIHVVGRSIGWRAYSWILSQIHWGIRIATAETTGIATEQVVNDVASVVITDAADVDDQLSRAEVRGWVRADLDQIGNRASEDDEWWLIDFDDLFDNLIPDDIPLL